MNRLAAASSNPKAATDAAKVYFSDLNDIIEFSGKKNVEVVTAKYAKSVADLETFKQLIQ